MAKGLHDSELAPWTDSLVGDSGGTAGAYAPGKQGINDARNQGGGPRWGISSPYPWQGLVRGRSGEHRGRSCELTDLVIESEDARGFR